MKRLFFALIVLTLNFAGDAFAEQKLESPPENAETRLRHLEQKHLAILEQMLVERRAKLALGGVNQGAVDELERAILQTTLGYAQSHPQRVSVMQEIVKSETLIRDRLERKVKLGSAGAEELLGQEARLLSWQIQLLKEQRK